jgi:N6-adenosine-specific RNA methylase IME4
MDQNDKKHRFMLRDRSKVQSPKPTLPSKRTSVSKYLPDSDNDSDYSDNNINAYEYDLENTNSIHFFLPRAKTQANKTQKILNSQKKKQKLDPELVAKQIIDKIIDAIETNSTTISNLHTNTYITCDLRYIDPERITTNFGYFDIIVVDPPWQNVANEVNTLTNQEILNIPLEKLSKGGFCFLWVVNSNINAGYECLNKWGYDVVDRLVWIRTLNEEKKIEIAPGKYFMKSSDMCLIGYKSLNSDRVEFRSKIANDIIVSDIKKNSQKPEQLYTIIDLMMPGSKKLEVFAKNKNLKTGWLSMGNEISERFINPKKTNCFKCGSEVNLIKYKNLKTGKNYCEDCKESEISLIRLDVSNNLHSYQNCAACSNIIIGIRFQCTVCDNVNMCEGNLKLECFDARVSCLDHPFNPHTFQQTSKTLPINEGKQCIKCLQRPILGPCIVCSDCPNLILCK